MGHSSVLGRISTWTGVIAVAVFLHIVFYFPLFIDFDHLRIHSRTPRGRPQAYLDMVVLGIRNLQPYQYLPMQLPYCVFEVRWRYFGRFRVWVQ